MSMYLGGVKVKAVKVGQTIEDVATVATLTQAEYNELPTKNSNTLYAITDAGEDNTVRLVKNLSDASMPSSAYWQSVCYGNGKFVAVASSSSTAAYSTDSITWRSTSLPMVASWSVCYGNGKFVAVAGGSSTAAYSTDGVDWTQISLLSSEMWQSVCYGNGKFVAVGANTNKVSYSTDGITWTSATLPSSAYWQSVCYGNGKFVAVAYNSKVAAYSANGITWTSATLPDKCQWSSVCYGNGKFVAVAANSSTIPPAGYSTDGITWTRTSLSSSGSWQSVCYGNGRFVAVAKESYGVRHSYDGIHWSDCDINYELQDSYGCDIVEAVQNTLGVSAPKAKLVTLTVAGWDSSAKTQSVTVSGILDDESKQMIIPMPATASMTAYNDAGIQCTGQAENTLTFTADTVPTEAIQVYVTYQDVISV